MGVSNRWIVQVSERLDALEAKPSPALDLAIEADQNKRLGALEETLSMLTINVTHLEADKGHTQALEQLCSKLAADVSRIDNKTEPAKGPTAKRLEELYEATTTLGASVASLYVEGKGHGDRIEVISGRIRDLVRVLSEWAPSGRDDGDAEPRPGSLPARLKHLITLTPNDLLTKPTDVNQ